MENSVTPDNIPVLCRICLTSSKNLSGLSEFVDVSEENWTIQDLLETVTLNKIVSDSTKFPSKICQICLSLLKLCYEFQVQFRNSQNVLESITKQYPVETKKHGAASAPVELIYGNKKFDLCDVLVVEDEQPKKHSFEGFLRNLGTEVSARFVSEDYRKPSSVLQEHTVAIEPLQDKAVRPQQDSENFQLMFQCKLCNTLFRSKHNLKNHIEVHHTGHNQFVCEHCGHVAHSTSALYHHLQNHKGKRFKCDNCDKRFVSSSRLREHRKVHSNERLFLCSVCGKNFNYSVALKYHLRLHTGEKKYACNYCGLNYRMPNTLKRHLRTHTHDKPYQCGHCYKKFPSSGEKTCHEMIHTGAKPYACQFCDKGFTTSWALQTHCLSHSGLFECHYCTKTFVDAKFVGVHMRRVHKSSELERNLG